jgi:hypothetical protein
MSTKNTFFLLFIIFTFASCVNDKINTDTQFIKIGNFSITRDEFDTKLIQLSSDLNKETLLDNLISAGLLISEAENMDYHDNTEFQNKIKSAELECKKEIIKNKLLNLENIQEKEIRKSYNVTGNCRLEIDYVRVPIKQKATYIEMFNIANTKKEMGLEVYLKAANWKKNGALFYENITVEPGYFIPEIEKRVSEIECDTILGVNSTSYSYIIRLKGRYKNPQYLGCMQKEEIRKRLAIAKQIESGNLFYDDYVLNKNITVKSDILKSIDFSCNPLANTDKSDDVIAICNGKNITTTQLLDGILSLPPEIQMFFENKITKRNAVKAWIVLKNKISSPDIISILREKLAVQSVIENELKIQQVKDTVPFLMKWLENIINQQSSISIKDFILSETSGNGIDKNIEFKLEKLKGELPSPASAKNDSLFWLSPQKIKENDLLRIDFAKLEKLKIPENKRYKSRILAYKGGWEITISDYINTLNKLSKGSKMSILRGDNPSKLIAYLATYEGKIADANHITIDHKTLNSLVRVTRNIVNFTDSLVKEDDVVGALDSIHITVDELRWKVFAMPENKKKEFMNELTREEAFRKLLIQEFWLRKGDQLNIDKDISYQKEWRKKLNCLLAELIYENKIYSEPLITTDENLNFCLRKALKEINQQRLQKFLFEASKKTKIYVNKKIFEDMGINNKETKYSRVINYY